jgi:hypothetical protein
MLLEKLPKADRMPPFCDGRSLSEHYLEKWKRKE